MRYTTLVSGIAGGSGSTPTDPLRVAAATRHHGPPSPGEPIRAPCRAFVSPSPGEGVEVRWGISPPVRPGEKRGRNLPPPIPELDDSSSSFVPPVLPLVLLDGGVPLGQVFLRDQVLVLLRDEQAGSSPAAFRSSTIMASRCSGCGMSGKSRSDGPGKTNVPRQARTEALVQDGTRFLGFIEYRLVDAVRR